MADLTAWVFTFGVFVAGFVVGVIVGAVIATRAFLNAMQAESQKGDR